MLLWTLNNHLKRCLEFQYILKGYNFISSSNTKYFPNDNIKIIIYYYMSLEYIITENSFDLQRKETKIALEVY